MSDTEHRPLNPAELALPTSISTAAFAASMQSAAFEPPPAPETPAFPLEFFRENMSTAIDLLTRCDREGPTDPEINQLVVSLSHLISTGLLAPPGTVVDGRPISEIVSLAIDDFKSLRTTEEGENEITAAEAMEAHAQRLRKEYAAVLKDHFETDIFKSQIEQFSPAEAKATPLLLQEVIDDIKKSIGEKPREKSVKPIRETSTEELHRDSIEELSRRLASLERSTIAVLINWVKYQGSLKVGPGDEFEARQVGMKLGEALGYAFPHHNDSLFDRPLPDSTEPKWVYQFDPSGKNSHKLEAVLEFLEFVKQQAQEAPITAPSL